APVADPVGRTGRGDERDGIRRVAGEHPADPRPAGLLVGGRRPRPPANHETVRPDPGPGPGPHDREGNAPVYRRGSHRRRGIPGGAILKDRVARLATYLEGREEAFVERLGELVAVDSGTGSVEGVDRVVERCADWLRTDGWSVERHAVDGPSGPLGTLVLAEQDGGGSGTTLVIGHTDTVFSDGTAAERPLRLDGDRILGPGV